MSKEEEAAKLLQDKIDQKNEENKGVLGRLESMEKTIIDFTKSVKPQEPEAKFDYASVDPVEMAKSLANDPDGQKEFALAFIENSHIDAIDVLDEDGYNIVTEELRKTIEAGESESAQVVGLILKTLDDNHKLAAKRDEVIMGVISQMAKSFTETSEELVNLKKAIGVSTGEISDLEGKIQNAGSSDLGGGEIEEGSDLIQDNTEVLSILKKSFLDGKPQSEQVRYYELTAMLSDGATHAELENQLEPNEMDIYQSNS